MTYRCPNLRLKSKLPWADLFIIDGPLPTLSRFPSSTRFETSKMLLMLALNVLEEDQERLRLLGRQISLSQVSDEGTLLRNVPVADFDVPPDHTEFGFAFAHRHIVAGRTRLVSVCFPPVADGR